MTSPNWYQIQQIALARSDHKSYRSTDSYHISKKKILLAMPILTLILAGVISFSSVGAKGASTQISPQPLISGGSPLVFISPGTVANMSMGSTFTVQVRVANMAQFNGWDIQIYTSIAAINATSLSITGNDFAVNASFGTPFELVHCVNGKGSGCTSNDGPSYVHSAYGNTASLTGNGLLFTITYKVIGNNFSPISQINSSISSPSSGNGDSHNTLNGFYAITLMLGTGAGGGGRAPLEL